MKCFINCCTVGTSFFKNYLLLFQPLLVLLFLATFSISSFAESDDLFPQKFRAKGNMIVDESGDEIVFRGVNAEDPVWQGSGLDPDIGIWSEDNFREMSEWGATIVRLPVHPATWRKLGVEESFGFIDQAIEWAEKFKMYVIVDFHSIGFVPENDFMDLSDIVFGQLYETTREEMFEFWRIFSERYADNNVVAFYELFNEPALDSALDFPAEFTIDDWMVWKQFNEDLIDSIRDIDPDKPIIVGGFQFAYDLSFVPEAPIERENVVYSEHPYPDANWKIGWDEAFANVKTDFPVFATEFGFDSEDFPEEPYNDNGGIGLYRDEIISLLEEKKISWTVWSFSHTFTPTLLLNLDFEPSESGAFFKEKLLEQAQAVETPGIPETPETPEPVETPETPEPIVTPTLAPVGNPTPSPASTPDPIDEKSFTFKCSDNFSKAVGGLERLILELGVNESCVLKLTNFEPGTDVEISTKIRNGSRSCIEVNPENVTIDTNNEIEFVISAIDRGVDWVAWAVPNADGEIEFNKNSYKKGYAWGMFVEVK